MREKTIKKHCYHRVQNILILAAVVSMIAALVTAVMTGTYYLPLVEESVSVTVSQGWQRDDGKRVSMPDFLDGTGDTQVSYTVTLPQADLAVRAPVLFFSSRYLNASFYLDGKHIGDSNSKPSGKSNSQGKVLSAIHLPADFAGRELRLEVELKLGKGVSYEIPAPVIGSQSGIVSGILRQGFPGALVDLAILCFSFILLLMGLLKGRIRQGRMFFCIGVFAMCFSLYSACTEDIIHLFYGNSSIVYISEFLLLALLPIPMVTAFETNSRSRLKWFLRADVALLSMNVILQAGLHFFTPLEVRNTVFLTHGAMLASLPLLSIALFKGWRDSSRHGTILAFFPVFTGALVDLGLFYLSDSYRSSFWVKVGVLLFVLLETYNMVKDYLERCERAVKAGFYEHMAYVDVLTGLKNRAAFEQRISELSTDPSAYSSLWCVCADINNLKLVNDNAGHSAGDLLIQSAAQVLKVIPPDDSAVYRTGGDEFVIFITDQTEQGILDGMRRLDEALTEYHRANTIPLSLAVGYDYFHFDRSDSVAELISRADKKMYEDKRRKKEIVDEQGIL